MLAYDRSVPFSSVPSPTATGILAPVTSQGPKVLREAVAHFTEEA
jgi:hypothetical protein